MNLRNDSTMEGLCDHPRLRWADAFDLGMIRQVQGQPFGVLGHLDGYMVHLELPAILGMLLPSAHQRNMVALGGEEVSREGNEVTAVRFETPGGEGGARKEDALYPSAHLRGIVIGLL